MIWKDESHGKNHILCTTFYFHRMSEYTYGDSGTLRCEHRMEQVGSHKLLGAPVQKL